jgi:hypothetical protein
MDKLIGFGIKRVQGRWCVLEIRSNQTGVHRQHPQQKSFIGAGIAADEAKGQAVITHTKYFYELK